MDKEIQEYRQESMKMFKALDNHIGNILTMMINFMTHEKGTPENHRKLLDVYQALHPFMPLVNVHKEPDCPNHTFCEFLDTLYTTTNKAVEQKKAE